MIESAVFYECIFGEDTMNSQDLALYQQAQVLANGGQMMAAYQIFRSLRERASDIEILFGIVTTTPDPNEAGQVIETIRGLQPYHPMLPQLEALHYGKIQRIYTGGIGPVLLCPYCGNSAPAITNSKISTGGWVTFVVLLIIFFPLCWIGLLIKEQYRVCSRCGSRIAAAF
jgi:LITAF-like zinc ribbon protein